MQRKPAQLQLRKHNVTLDTVQDYGSSSLSADLNKANSSSTSIDQSGVEVGKENKQPATESSPPQSIYSIHHEYNIPSTAAKPSLVALGPALPLVLALLPAGTAVLAGETAGVFVTDTLLLTAAAWVLYIMRETTWSQCRPDASAKLPAIIYMATPVAGGLLLRFVREQLSVGSKLVTNFNIFLYVVLETARGGSKLASLSDTVRDQSVVDDRRMVDPLVEQYAEAIARINHQSSQIYKLEQDVKHSASKISALARRIDEQESAMHQELYTVWHGMDQISTTPKRQQHQHNSIAPTAATTTTRRQSNPVMALVTLPYRSLYWVYSLLLRGASFGTSVTTTTTQKP